MLECSYHPHSNERTQSPWILQHRKRSKTRLPHTLTTRVGAVNLYRYTHEIDFVLRRYHISKASLMRWNRQFDGTKESLESKSHRPHSQHPNAHTEEERKWIRDYHRIYAYKEASSYSTIDFVTRAIRSFGYAPEIIQTDNGGEFTHARKTERVHPLDALCEQLHITHKTIRPRTPWHNGKVGRSHRNDQERFYNHLSFYSFEDLQAQMTRYLYRSNRIPMAVLGWKSPIQKRRELVAAARLC